MVSFQIRLSRSVVLAVLAGLSVSVLLAGYFLNKTRRRYRAVSTQPSMRHGNGPSLQRSSTFQAESTPFLGSVAPSQSVQQHYKTRCLFSSESPLPQLSNHSNKTGDETSDEEDFVEAPDLLHMPQGVRTASPAASDSSSDSFHSTMGDMILDLPLHSHHHLYHTGLQHATMGLVPARTLRTEELHCAGDLDFLAKLYCVRLAFDELVAVPTNRLYFEQMGREVMSSFLASSGQDPSLFCERFNGLLSVLVDDEGRRQAEEELRLRGVVAMNVYDVALDFVLLDAFSDLDHPPSTVVAVLQNTWITDGMKKSALSAAVWSLLKAKRSMLRNKDGFMGHFYLLSEVLTPVMAWGFLGTDSIMQQHCLQLKATVSQFLQGVFSLEGVRYTTVSSLAEDILTLAQHTANAMTPTLSP